MYKEIDRHPDYVITDYGEVISSKGKNLRVLMPDCSNGYPRVTIDNERWYVADLVAEYFLRKPKDSNYKIFYIDGNKENCRVDNLVYLSQSDIKRYSQFSVEYRRQVLGEWA